MTNETDPVVGQWYMHRDKGEMFRVVAVDGITGSVELQDFNGDIEEFDLDSWRELDIEPAEAPEDWTGPYDEISADDLGYNDAGAAVATDWRRTVEAVADEEEPWEDLKDLSLELEDQ